MEAKESSYDATTDFVSLEEIFTRLKEEDTTHFGERALQDLEKRKAGN
jgi:hypothetical protein